MDYPFANGTIKALETKIQDRNKLFVLNKYEKNEFVKVLLAMNYGGEGTTVEELINAENEKVKELINSITPCKKDTDLFYLVNDAQNIKVLYKVKKYQLAKEDLLNNSGTISIEVLKNAIINNDMSNTPKYIKELILEINEKIEKVTSPKIVSSIIDQSVYQYALNKTNNKILINYLICKIDFTNVISMFRAKNLGWGKNEYFEMFIDGGKIKKEEILSAFDLTKEEQIKLLEKYYDEKISKILSKTTSINECQLEFDRLLIMIMSQYKDEPFSIGPMIYYYLLKQAEAQNIRILYALKKVELKDLI